MLVSCLVFLHNIGVGQKALEPIGKDRQMEQTYEERLEAARQWQKEQDARPISETIRLLDEAEAKARLVAELAWSANRVARDVKLRYVSANDAQDIQDAISRVSYSLEKLNKMLGSAVVSLNEIVEA